MVTRNGPLPRPADDHLAVLEERSRVAVKEVVRIAAHREMAMPHQGVGADVLDIGDITDITGIRRVRIIDGID